jgi:hypothetical protein
MSCTDRQTLCEGIPGIRTPTKKSKRAIFPIKHKTLVTHDGFLPFAVWMSEISAQQLTCPTQLEHNTNTTEVGSPHLF